MFSKTEDNALKVAEMHKRSINKKCASLTLLLPYFFTQFSISFNKIKFSKKKYLSFQSLSRPLIKSIFAIMNNEYFKIMLL